MKNDWNKNETGYTGYEYREITVSTEHSSLCLDSYPCFGWEPDPNKKILEMRESVTLYFRRNRAIANKAELTRLQRNFDSCISELNALKQSKSTTAFIAALSVGIVGTAFMAGSTFAAVAEPPILWLMILLAIPGLIGWIAPYFLHRTLVRKKTRTIEPLMEETYDEIDAICERASHLLH